MRSLYLGQCERTDLDDLVIYNGYSNVDGKRLELTKEDFKTHIHIVGAPRSGKSKLMEHIARQLIYNKQGLCVIDPHGNLYNDLLNYLVATNPPREIILFNPSYREKIVGFNPFLSTGGDPNIQATRMSQAAVKAWGMKNTNDTPRLERWLQALFLLLIENNYPLGFIDYLVTFGQKELRNYLIDSIKSSSLKTEMEYLKEAKKVTEFYQQIESTKNKLGRFLRTEQIKRIVGLDINNINIKDIIENGKILLVNLQTSDYSISSDDANLLGTLLLSEITSYVKQRRKDKRGHAPSDFYTIIDEFQNFLTPDIPTMLSECPKYGLHLILGHQFINQLKEEDNKICSSVMGTAQIKICFGGLSSEDANLMVKELFPGQINKKRIRFLNKQIQFWPRVVEKEIITETEGGGTTKGTQSMSGGGGSNTHSSGMNWDGFSYHHDTNFSQSDSRSSSDNWSDAYSETESSNWSKSKSKVPFIYPVKKEVIVNTDLYNTEDTVDDLAGLLTNQFQRHFIIRRPGRPTLAGITPFVNEYNPSEGTIKRYVEKKLKNFLSSEEVDKAIEDQKQQLIISSGIELKGIGSGSIDVIDVEFNPDNVWEKTSEEADEEDK